MVSFSPMAAMNRATIFGDGFTRASRSPTKGVTITRKAAGKRVPGKSGDPREQHEPANSFRTGEGVPEGPEPAPRGSSERGRLQPERIQDLVDEFDSAVSVAFAGNVDGIAQPESGTIRVDRPHTLEMRQEGKMGQRGRTAAV